MLLMEKYNTEIVPVLQKKLGLKNRMLVPSLKKIVVNCSSGDALVNAKVLEAISHDLMMITGQKPVVRKAKKSIATFKLRAGQPIGVSVTLRGKRMHEFFNRLVNIALPRSRDFKGLSRKAFDGRGNYTLGVSEQIIFPEILPEKVDKIRGMNITIVTSACDDQKSFELLAALGFPFRA